MRPLHALYCLDTAVTIEALEGAPPFSRFMREGGVVDFAKELRRRYDLSFRLFRRCTLAACVASGHIPEHIIHKEFPIGRNHHDLQLI